MSDFQNWFLHVDLDAFFASVEQLDHPEYRGKPVIVGGKPEDRRGVVSTASYEARVFGVHSAMPTATAYKLCPQGIFVHGRMDRYSELSCKIMNILHDYSPDVDQMSIDEAFIDLTGTDNLFGPPEETALKIKKRIFDEIGLTVSIGIATTKYFAKIASDINKPNGIYFVHPGTEQEFMLNLPVKKIFGIGTKTQEVLKQSGLFTTRDIFEKSREALQFITGNNTGNFLYNIVRGIVSADSFSKETNSHSISAETTFPYDVYDTYTVETKIMELAHNVMFRLLRENCFSKTVMIKIRYEDFSTVSIQETQDKNILILDTFYSIAKKLFEKKFEKGRGVRLIGIGFENVKEEDSPFQQDLFEENSAQKKQAVEKAILKLEKKHPEIHVHKARTLNSNKVKSILLFLLLSLPFFTGRLSSLTAAEPSNNGAAGILKDDEVLKNDDVFKNLFSLNFKNDNYLDFLVSGYWKGEFFGSVLSTFGNNKGFKISGNLPVFKQEIDLSAEININENWFFNLEFLDEFNKNTYTIGYKGKKYLNEFKFSNRNIIFPSLYSSNLLGYGLGGGENEAPGIILHFNDYDLNKWQGDFLLRYDMLKSKNATFFGYNSVTETQINPAAFISGKIFVLPDSQSVNSVKDIYVQNSSGTYTDKNGRKFIKLNSTEYQKLAAENLIILENEPKALKNNDILPAVLFTFNSSGDYEYIITKSGSYSDAASFLGQIQSWFGDIPVEKYVYETEAFIDGEKALTVQSPYGFSPYNHCGKYDCGITDSADVMVISTSSEKPSNTYIAQISDNYYSSSPNNFFNENHIYADVYNADYKLKAYSDPAIRYPFADKVPLIYLTKTNTSDLAVVVRNYSQIQNFDIGRDAAQNSVQVYINGVLDIGAKYDPNTGYVTLSKTVSETDKIYITYQENSSDFMSGAISAGAGFIYNFTPSLTGDLSLTAKWSVSPYSGYADSENSQNSFAAFTTGLNYEKEKFKITDKLSASLQTQNVTGNYLASTLDDIQNTTYYLNSTNGYETNTIPSLNIPFAPELSGEKNITVKGHTGIKDYNISGYKLPLYFNSADFDEAAAEGSTVWASMDVKLLNGDRLSSSSEVQFALLPGTDLTGWDVYLQLGIQAENNFAGEMTRAIPTWKLNDSLELNQKEWQTVTVGIAEEQRAKLSNFHDARLILVKENFSKNDVQEGVIYFGPYEPHNKGCFVSANEGLNVNTTITSADFSPSSKTFISDDSYASDISWNIKSTILNDEDYKITAINYFSSADFTAYKKVNLDFYYDVLSQSCFTGTFDDKALTILLDEGAEAADEDGIIALSLSIKGKAVSPLLLNRNWHTLSININTYEVFFDNQPLDSSNFELYINKTVVPVREKVVLNTVVDNSLIEKGDFILGNLYFTECTPDFSVKNYTALEYKNPDTLLKIKDFDLLKNVNASVISTQSFVMDTADAANNTTSLDASLNTGLTFAGIVFNADGYVYGTPGVTEPENILQNAGHVLKSENPILQSLTLEENYRYNHSGNSLDKYDFVKLNLSKIKVPLTVVFSSKAQQTNILRTQNSLLQADLAVPVKDWEIIFNATGTALQKENLQKLVFDNYFTNYADITSLQFSNGNPEAYNRKLELSSLLGLSIPSAALKPSLKYLINGEYSSSNSIQFIDSETFSLNIPFTIKNNAFSFNYEKTGGGIQPSSADGNYKADIEQLSKTQKNRTWLYTAVPFYDLFSYNLQAAVLQETLNQSAYYSSKYEIEWKRKLSNSIKDLYIPQGLSLAITRDLRATEAVNDYYQIKTTVSNAFVNLFGSQSFLKKYDWYKSDEYISSLTAAFKIPYSRPQETTFILNFYSSLLFYISDIQTLKTGFDFSFESINDFRIRATAVYNRPAENTFLLLIPLLFNKNLDTKIFIISRKDYVNIDAGIISGLGKQVYEYNHSCTLKFLKNYSINTGIGGILAITENSTSSFSLEYSLGGVIEF